MAINKIEATLKGALKQAIIACGFVEEYDQESITIEIPKDKSHGDYSTNLAMQLTKLLKRNPRQIAEAIIEALDKENANIEKVEIAGPGFINLFLAKDAMTSIIKEVLEEKEAYGTTTYGQGTKYNVEFVSANPTGDLHLGHAKGAAVGDSICRIMSAAGYDVTREYYINDAGNQIHNLALSLYARYKQAFGQDVTMPEDGYHGKDIIDIATKIKEIDGDKYLEMDEGKAIAFFRNKGTEYELQKIKDILNELLANKPLDLEKLMHKPMFVPRAMESFRVLEKFRESEINEAVVLDEYGGVVGFITIFDIINEVLGDITGKPVANSPQIIQRDEHSWYIDGLFDIDDFKEKFDIEVLPNEDSGHFQTMGGFITSYFGYIPKVGEKIIWHKFRFEIISMDKARIDRILVTQINKK